MSEGKQPTVDVTKELTPAEKHKSEANEHFKSKQ